MNTQAHAVGAVKSASIAAVKIDRHGLRTDLGTISYWHRNPLKRLAWWWSRQRLVDQALLALAAALVVAICVIGGLAGLGVVLATVFTHAGKAITTNRVMGAGTEPKWVAWGTGAGTAAVGDTTLFTESSEETRTSGSSSQVTTTQTNDTYQVIGTITVATSNKTITNAGLFDAASVGNLFMKGDFTGIPVNIGESIQFTCKVQYT